MLFRKKVPEILLGKIFLPPPVLESSGVGDVHVKCGTRLACMAPLRVHTALVSFMRLDSDPLRFVRLVGCFRLLLWLLQVPSRRSLVGSVR